MDLLYNNLVGIDIEYLVTLQVDLIWLSWTLMKFPHINTLWSFNLQ